MISKKDLMFSSYDHEKANERIEKHFGNYIYIARLKPCKRAVWDKLLERWLIEWKDEATEQQVKEFGLVFVRRGNLMTGKFKEI
ncbi:hypothetical protein [Enterococcus devriesei]|uniref:hypothetical protein n=1 Tax=Enterococcus devriesei TaxID=319970 RepID=UPI0028EC3D55|nr:hypothetical protein [Enterococcus devriesei]